MIGSVLPVKDPFRDRLGPVPKRTKRAGEIFVRLMDSPAEMNGTDKGQPNREEQEVVVKRAKMQMGKAVTPDEPKELANETAVRTVPGLDEKVGRRPTLLGRPFAGEVMVGNLR